MALVIDEAGNIRDTELRPEYATHPSYMPLATGLARLFRQPDVTLPRSVEAQDEFRDLELAGVGGLQTLLGEDTSARRKAIEDAYYKTAEADIDYSADRTLREGLENTFGRNVGLSTITGDYVVEPVERARNMAKERARNTAFTTAGQDVRAEQNQRLTALGQAFNQGATGLRDEATIAATNRSANQAAMQTGMQTGLTIGENERGRGQQESQFSRSLAQQKELQEKGFTNAREIASNAAVGAGIGGGLEGLANIFGPSIDRTLRGFGF